MKRPVRVIGAGGHAKVLVATLDAAGFDTLALHDDEEVLWGSTILGRPVVGPVAALAGSDCPVVIGIGNNGTRARLARELDLSWASVVHPSATVHASVTISAGAVVFAGAVIQPETIIGAHAIVNTSASVDHDCRIGAFVHVAPGVHLCGGVDVGEGVLLGVGASVIPLVRIGAWSVIGAGAACVRDIPERSLAIGVPARVTPFPQPLPPQTGEGEEKSTRSGSLPPISGEGLG